jgi:hypothetical protein
MTKGEKRVISISVFFILACVACNVNKKTFLCVACDTLLACITLSYYEFYDIYIWIIILSIYLFHIFMKCVVVPLYPCHIDVILCIFTFATLSCHMITLFL